MTTPRIPIARTLVARAERLGGLTPDGDASASAAAQRDLHRTAGGFAAEREDIDLRARYHAFLASGEPFLTYEQFKARVATEGAP